MMKIFISPMTGTSHGREGQQRAKQGIYITNQIQPNISLKYRIT